MSPLNSGILITRPTAPTVRKKKNVNLKHVLELSLHVLMRASWTLRRVFYSLSYREIIYGGLAPKQKETVHRKKMPFTALLLCLVFIFSYMQDTDPFSLLFPLPEMLFFFLPTVFLMTTSFYLGSQLKCHLL